MYCWYLGPEKDHVEPSVRKNPSVYIFDAVECQSKKLKKKPAQNTAPPEGKTPIPKHTPASSLCSNGIYEAPVNRPRNVEA